MTGFDPPTTVYGVDFSGARRAGESIYLARGTADEGALDVESCIAAPDLLETDAAREAVLPALRSFLADAGGRTAFGLDFSFGLPAFLLDAAGVDDWAAFVRWFPNGFADASEFSAWARERAAERAGDRTYYPRETDRAVGATSPYHFFVKAQTFHGVRDVLKPLVEADAARVLPMQDPDPDLPWALEAYPAATLDRLGAHRERYKTSDEAGRRRRTENLEALAALDGVSVAPAVRDRAVADADGDALDAVVAAVATWERTRRAERLRPSGTAWRREGHIFH
ncbi:DUF429 domain-containing protein [Halogeometricum sp. S1BR25-6]|uniref:DUF429 domain-containing protein n=1 Tax=Halogeometricum salsisoli TaxID=2950536 RepID=A0ABU2GB28_9EURY|nr:DUF429 domain-containing protein [Halogeometricum sp. S1BR25-6]MDS0297944.1 DUF429 domain-containing protein [Halogeometricum sp. S1BR25-6]